MQGWARTVRKEIMIEKKCSEDGYWRKITQDFVLP